MSDLNSSTSTGKTFWRSIEQLAGSPETLKHLEQEFPSYDPSELVGSNGFSRRSFMNLMAASMALAGVTLSGCRRWPKEEILAQTTGMKGQMPGVPEHYATVYDRAGFGFPLLITAWDGRPIKVEGNNMHPSVATFAGRVGSSDVHSQASTLEMYDPDRSRGVLDLRSSSAQKPAPNSATLGQFVEQFSAALSAQAGGAGVAVLSEASSSITLAEIRRGIALISRRDAAQAETLRDWCDRLQREYGRTGRLLPIRAAEAGAWGELMAVRTLSILDGFIAATARVHDLTLVTRNNAHFEGLPIRVENPFAKQMK